MFKESACGVQQSTWVGGGDGNDKAVQVSLRGYSELRERGGTISGRNEAVGVSLYEIQSAADQPESRGILPHTLRTVSSRTR